MRSLIGESSDDMGEIFREILGHLLGQFIGEEQFFVGFGFAFSFWCFDWALIEWSKRRVSSLILWIVGSALLVLLFIPAWNTRALIGSLLMGIVFYIPLRASMKRRPRHG